MTDRTPMDGQQAMDLLRRVHATVPKDLTKEEAQQLLESNGLYRQMEQLWVSIRSEISSSSVTRGMVVLAEAVMIPVSMILNGIVLSVLWGWFIAAKFALPPLGIAEAIGITILFGVLTFNLSKQQRNDRTLKDKLKRVIAFPFVKAAFALLLGYVVYLFT